MLKAERGHRFDLSGGHPALDFVNTLDERLSPTPIERLPSYHSLCTFAELLGLVERKNLRRQDRPPSRVAERALLARAHALRQSSFSIFRALAEQNDVVQRDLDLITDAISAAHNARRLKTNNHTRAIRWQWRDLTALEVPLHACALAIETLISSPEIGRVKICAASDCAVLFLDASRNRMRRWCSMVTCGNREKQRVLRRKGG